MHKDRSPLLPQLFGFPPFWIGVITVVGMALLAFTAHEIVPWSLVGGGLVGLLAGLMVSTCVSVIAWHFAVAERLTELYGFRQAVDWLGIWQWLGIFVIISLGTIVGGRWLAQTIENLSWLGAGAIVVIGVMIWAALQDPLRNSPVSTG